MGTRKTYFTPPPPFCVANCGDEHAERARVCVSSQISGTRSLTGACDRPTRSAFAPPACGACPAPTAPAPKRRPARRRSANTLLTGVCAMVLAPVGQGNSRVLHPPPPHKRRRTSTWEPYFGLLRVEGAEHHLIRHLLCRVLHARPDQRRRLFRLDSRHHRRCHLSHATGTQTRTKGDTR